MQPCLILQSANLNPRRGRIARLPACAEQHFRRCDSASVLALQNLHWHNPCGLSSNGAKVFRTKKSEPATPMNADRYSSPIFEVRKRTSRPKGPARVAPRKLWGSERVWPSVAFKYPCVRRYRAAAFVAVFYTNRDVLTPMKGGDPLHCERSPTHGSRCARLRSVRWRTLQTETMRRPSIAGHLCSLTYRPGVRMQHMFQ
jgi:hypothetical protein